MLRQALEEHVLVSDIPLQSVGGRRVFDVLEPHGPIQQASLFREAQQRCWLHPNLPSAILAYSRDKSGLGEKFPLQPVGDPHVLDLLAVQA